MGIGGGINKAKDGNCITTQGDADEYHVIDLVFNLYEIENELTSNVKLCNKLNVLEKSAHGIDTKTYSNVIPELENTKLWEEWPTECNSGIPDRYTGHTVFYFDNNGAKYKVNTTE